MSAKTSNYKNISVKKHRLFGISTELDEIIYDFGYLAERFKDFHPANNGDISQVLSKKTGKLIINRFKKTASSWFEISHIQDLANIRNDGRTGYRSEGTNNAEYFEMLKPMAGRITLVTCTASDVPAIQSSIDQGLEGKLFNIVEVDKTARRIRILYGNHEYGTIPSIETHIHIVSNAMSISEGVENPSTVHTHPFNMILLGRDKKINGDLKKYNAILYSQNGVVKNMHPDLVGITQYCKSGSAKLALESLQPLKINKIVLWMNHGLTVRNETIRKGYILTSYLDDAARYALDNLRGGSLGLPEEEIHEFLNEKDLLETYNSITK